MSVLGIFMAHAMSLGLGSFLMLPTTQQPGKSLWAAGIVMLIIGAILGYFGLRALKAEPRLRIPSSQPISSLDEFVLRYQQENAPPLVERYPELKPLLDKMRECKEKDCWSALAAELAVARQQYPERFDLAEYHVFALVNSEQFAAAERCANDILSRPELGRITRQSIFHQQARAIAKQGDTARFCAAYEDLLRVTPVDEQAPLCELVAWLPFMDDVAGISPEAYEWSKRALSLAPELVLMHMTYAALLFEQGYVREAELIFRLAYVHSPHGSHRGIAALFLALTEKKKKNLTDAQGYVFDAKLLHPEPWLLRRIRREFGSAA